MLWLDWQSRAICSGGFAGRWSPVPSPKCLSYHDEKVIQLPKKKSALRGATELPAGNERQPTSRHANPPTLSKASLSAVRDPHPTSSSTGNCSQAARLCTSNQFAVKQHQEHQFPPKNHHHTTTKMSSHTTLAAATDDRKARLAKLKSLKRKQPSPSPSDEAPSPSRSQSPPTKQVSHLHLSGRNYDPETKGPKLGFEAPPTLSLEAPTLEEQAADLQDEVNRQAAIDAAQAAEKGIDLFKLQPKKPNWDLKRELNAKMEVLNVRTDNAIAGMVRERLAEKKKVAEQSHRGSKESEDKEADGMLDGAAIVEGIKLREREEEEEARREKEAEDEELGLARRLDEQDEIVA